jgi:hypothetical protein
MTEPADVLELSSRSRANVDYDVAKWIPCPPAFPPGYNLEQWARTFAEAFSKRPGMSPAEQQIAGLAAQLTYIHQYTYGNVACHLAFIYLPDPRLAPMPVFMATWQARGDRDMQLRRLANADDPDATQPPFVSDFSTRLLGTGLKVLRYGTQVDGSGDIFAALNYAWRIEKLDTDLRIFASSADLGRLQQAMPDIDELAQVTSVVPA